MTVSKSYPTPLTPPKVSNVKYLNFAITNAVVNIFAEIMHAGRGAINTKHMKQDFSLRACVQSPGVVLGVDPRPKLTFFSEYDYVAYQIKADDTCRNMVANVFPTDTPSTPRVGSKGQSIFLKVVMLHVKLRKLSIERHESKYLPFHIPPTPGVGSKGHCFLF